MLVVQATVQPFYFQFWPKFIKSSVVNFYFRPVQNRWCLHIFGMILTVHIVQVEAGDSGQYRCRVDYEVSPTRNTRIKLKLIGNS